MKEPIYKHCVAKYVNNFTRISIDPQYAKKIKEFAEQIVNRKQGEAHHQIDNGQELKRFTTGLMGEAALEKLFNMNIIDWTVGDSRDYHKPDVPGYDVGIKSVEEWKFPIIFKENSYPQIICILSHSNPCGVFVCGLASTDVLNKYQDDILVLSPKLRERGTKTGFWGFQYLTRIQSLSDIEQYRKI